MIITTRTIEFSLFYFFKLILKILIRKFDNQTWSQQSIEAFHENQRIIWTHKYSGVQTNVLRIQET